MYRPGMDLQLARGLPRWVRWALGVGIAIGGASVLTGCETYVQSFEVNTAVDVHDANLGDGVCDIGDGTCSLRAALDEANHVVGKDRITIAPGVDPVITLTGAYERQNASGDLDVRDDVTIIGGGATVDANGIGSAFHVDAHQVTIMG